MAPPSASGRGGSAAPPSRRAGLQQGPTQRSSQGGPWSSAENIAPRTSTDFFGPVQSRAERLAMTGTPARPSGPAQPIRRSQGNLGPGPVSQPREKRPRTIDQLVAGLNADLIAGQSTGRPLPSGGAARGSHATAPSHTTRMGAPPASRGQRNAVSQQPTRRLATPGRAPGNGRSGAVPNARAAAYSQPPPPPPKRPLPDADGADGIASKRPKLTPASTPQDAAPAVQRSFLIAEKKDVAGTTIQADRKGEAEDGKVKADEKTGLTETLTNATSNAVAAKEPVAEHDQKLVEKAAVDDFADTSTYLDDFVPPPEDDFVPPPDDDFVSQADDDSAPFEDDGQDTVAVKGDEIAQLATDAVIEPPVEAPAKPTSPKQKGAKTKGNVDMTVEDEARVRIARNHMQEGTMKFCEQERYLTDQMAAGNGTFAEPVSRIFKRYRELDLQREEVIEDAAMSNPGYPCPPPGPAYDSMWPGTWFALMPRKANDEDYDQAWVADSIVVNMVQLDSEKWQADAHWIHPGAFLVWLDRNVHVAEDHCRRLQKALDGFKKDGVMPPIDGAHYPRPGEDIPASAKFVVFAMNSGVHWVTVMIRPDLDTVARRGRIVYYDSLNTDSVRNRVTKVIPLLADLIGAGPDQRWDQSDWSVVQGQSTIQPNAHDCGIITGDNCSRLMQGLEPVVVDGSKKVRSEHGNALRLEVLRRLYPLFMNERFADSYKQTEAPKAVSGKKAMTNASMAPPPAPVVATASSSKRPVRRSAIDPALVGDGPDDLDTEGLFINEDISEPDVEQGTEEGECAGLRELICNVLKGGDSTLEHLLSELRLRWPDTESEWLDRKVKYLLEKTPTMFDWDWEDGEQAWRLLRGLGHALDTAVIRDVGCWKAPRGGRSMIAEGLRHPFELAISIIRLSPTSGRSLDKRRVVEARCKKLVEAYLLCFGVEVDSSAIGQGGFDWTEDDVQWVSWFRDETGGRDPLFSSSSPNGEAISDVLDQANSKAENRNMPMRVRLLGNGVDGITVNSESWDQLRTRWRHLDFSISLAIPIDAWGADNAFSPLVESSRGLKWLHYQVAKLASAYGGTVPVEPTGSMLHMDDEGVQEYMSQAVRMHHAQFLVICQLCWIERLDHSLKCRRDQPNVQLSVPSDNRLSYRIERAFHRNMFDLSSELEADVAVDGAELLNELLEGGHAAAVHHKDDTSSSNQLSRFGLACTIDELEAESASHPANIGMALLANEIKLATGINSYSGSSKGQLPSGTTAATYPWMEHQPQPQPLVYEVIPKGATQKVDECNKQREQKSLMSVPRHDWDKQRAGPACQRTFFFVQTYSTNNTAAMSMFSLDKLKSTVQDIGDTVSNATKRGPEKTHGHVHHTGECTEQHLHHDHPYQSFAAQRQGNDCKWYVDGCSYMYAVSMALEHAQHEIWILDWWLSPELYLRRPPAQNEKYRLDKMLFAAAERGVKINIIVYKEVTQALTLSSSHTKHWLEDNDKTNNIRVFRHPDHLPDRTTMTSNFLSSIKQSGMNPSKLVSLPGDALKGIYGMGDDSILFWAHHEKLCVVDGQIAFMGGLDLCFGRWDTNQHSISDAHPGDLNSIIFPGQDYNNARIMDFQQVSEWQNNKLDRKFNSRMGWTDVALSLRGPVIEDLRAHFAQRWNFIYFEKYEVRNQEVYHPITFKDSKAGVIGHPYQQTEGNEEPDGHGQYKGFRDRMQDQLDRGRKKVEEVGQRMDENRGMMDNMRHGRFGHPVASDTQLYGRDGGMHCQIVRSCAKWSHGVPVEHSIANAYIQTIKNSEHFIYIENQFFITATSPQQQPVKNKIGGAIAERIIRAAQNHEDWHMIVNIPAVPGFAGDLKADDALGTRAIMEFQYFSINRGGHSIMETVAKAGVDPMKYIRFYNLRNYDRINSSKEMHDVEQRAGVSYDEARKGHDQRFGQVGDSENYGHGHQQPRQNEQAFERYQQAAQETHGVQGHKSWDSVASCYMLNGEDIRNVPWNGTPQSELEAFVSEELYIHSKLLIADDRKVICGSANLNDRSQLGNHDSEIAIIIEDRDSVDSYMAGRPWRASKFAASLRRQIFRKHLGLIQGQDPSRRDASYTPVGHDPNTYDWGSREDHAVADPLSESFLNLWKTTARTNTEAFRKVFHPVPDDTVKNWKQYTEFYEKHFTPQQAAKEGKEQKNEKPATYKTGHVLFEKFHGEEGLREVKECLSRVRGTIVEMPLLFLKEEDIAKEGLGLNALTEEVYT